MSKEERIRELERRVEELESRPITVTIYQPAPPPPAVPYPWSPWLQPYCNTTSAPLDNMTAWY